MKKSLWSVDSELKKLKQEIIDAAAKAAESENDKQPTEHLAHQLTEKDLLAVGTEELQNQVALENARFFKRRFGFLKPREQRWHVITLKTQLDFTDEEIRDLEYGKVIVCEKGKNTVVKADRVPYYMGLAMFSLLCYPLLLVLALFILGNLPPTSRLLGIICCLIAWRFVFSFCNKLAIRPIKLLQQRGMKLGEAIVFDGKSFVRG